MSTTVIFCFRFLFERGATGGVLPTAVFRTAKLLRYITPLDHAVFGFEILLWLFTFYYLIEEFLEVRHSPLRSFSNKFFLKIIEVLLKMKAKGWRYLKSFMNILDMVIILMSLVILGFNAYRCASVEIPFSQI